MFIMMIVMMIVMIIVMTMTIDDAYSVQDFLWPSTHTLSRPHHTYNLLVCHENHFDFYESYDLIQNGNI